MHAIGMANIPKTRPNQQQIPALRLDIGALEVKEDMNQAKLRELVERISELDPEVLATALRAVRGPREEE